MYEVMDALPLDRPLVAGGAESYVGCSLGFFFFLLYLPCLTISRPAIVWVHAMVSVPIGPFIHLTPNGPFSSFYIKKKLFWSLDAVVWTNRLIPMLACKVRRPWKLKSSD
jgi:hypothetical protein